MDKGRKRGHQEARDRRGPKAHQACKADIREDRADRREDQWDRREDRRDRAHDGGRRDKREDQWDRREDRADRAEDRYDQTHGCSRR